MNRISIGLSDPELASRVARDLHGGSYVNLGIGLPTLVADYIDEDNEIVIHSENGILGVGPSPNRFEERDTDLINAGKQFVTLRDGGSFFDHALSFSMVRGGHLDLCILGAYQVSLSGDLANWSLGKSDQVPAVGGAMDLAVGARDVWVMMKAFGKDGDCKIVRECSLPLTGTRCVSRIYTDLGIFACGAKGLTIMELVPGLLAEELAWSMGLELAACDKSEVGSLGVMI